MSVLASAVVCPICAREYSEEEEAIPRILSECGHTLCTDCAQRIVTGSLLACPFDRTRTRVKDGEVKNLKKNFSILQIREDEILRKKQRLMTKHEKKKRNNDGTCDENSAHEATSFCEHCEADLCDACWDYVHSPPILAHHDKLALFVNIPIEAPECKDHPGEKVAFVCKLEKCCFLQNRLMCPDCFRRGSSHKGHSYVPLQSEVKEMRTKIKDVLQIADDKEVAILKNIESLETVENAKLALKELKKSVDRRRETLEQRIAEQMPNLDWIKKNREGIKRLTSLSNIELIEKRFEVNMYVARIENAHITHLRSLVPCSMCIVHVPSLSPMTVDIKPPVRLEIREGYHNSVSNFIKQSTRPISSKNRVLRYKTHFLQLIERTPDTTLYSERLSKRLKHMEK